MANLGHLRVGVASVLVAAFCAAQAAPLTYNFAGTIGSIENVGPDYNLTELAVGDTFTGSFTFDSSAMDGDPDGTFGFYTGGAFEFVSNGMVSSCAACAGLLVENNNPGDALYLGATPTGGSTFGSLFQLGFVLEVRYPGSTVFASDALPLNAALGSFSYTQFRSFPAVVDGLTQTFGGLTSFTGPVPEPGTYALMLAGLSAIGLFAKRGRARNQAGSLQA